MQGSQARGQDPGVHSGAQGEVQGELRVMLWQRLAPAPESTWPQPLPSMALLMLPSLPFAAASGLSLSSLLPQRTLTPLLASYTAEAPPPQEHTETLTEQRCSGKEGLWNPGSCPCVLGEEIRASQAGAKCRAETESGQGEELGYRESNLVATAACVCVCSCCGVQGKMRGWC